MRNKLETLTINYLDLDSSSKLISPGSFIRVKNKPSDFELGTVTISGEVNEPGSYRLTPNETLFTLIKKSGGLKKDAYIEGLILLREEKKEEKSIES